MNASTIIDIETPSGLFLAAPAHVFQQDRHTDVEMPSDLVGSRGDMGFISGRFCQFDDGTNTAFNRNGNMFSPPSYVHDAAKLVRYTPLNMLHRRRDVIGTFVGTSVVDPKGVLADAAGDKALPFPYIDSLAAMWRYHFREEWDLINRAYDQGACWLSMEAVAQTLTCFTPDCGCDGATFDYMGITSPAYCDSLQKPRARKRLNYPHFVGGAMVVPPAMPAWRRADITKIAASVEAHPDEAELVYEQIAATASHLEPAEWEFIMAMIVSGAFDEDNTMTELAQADVDRIFACLISTGELKQRHADSGANAAEAQAAEAQAGVLVAAGLAVVAASSGRLLLLQRADDPEDPASGMWELPGGHIDPGESALEAAKREFAEEIGCAVPDGQIVGTWTSPNGVYQAFVLLVESESLVQCNLDPRHRLILNPDLDPDHDNAEVAAWWDPKTLPGMPALRSEMESTDWDQINTATETPDGIDPTAVNYREAGDEESRCGECAYFDPMSTTCQLVAGVIDPNWVCDLFAAVPEGSALDPIESGVSRVPASG